MVLTRATPRGARSLALLPPWLPPPETIGAVIGGRYRITHRIAEGTTGVVHGAEDLREGITVALRLLRPELSAAPGVLEYLEARRGGPLAVAGLAELRDVGRTGDGLIYEVVDHLDGEHLGAHLQRRGRMPWARARGIVRRLASILGELHRLGGHHGFLQSRSCYVLADGADAAILAPGLDAFLIDEGASLLSAATLTIGRYAAPERASGDPSDHRVDVYALGVILYELLTARLPFEDVNPNRLLAMHMLAPVPSPREVAPTAAIPEAVEAMILRALAKDPGERWPTMAAMIEAIDACTESTTATPSPKVAAVPVVAAPPVLAPAPAAKEPSGSVTAAAVEAALASVPASSPTPRVVVPAPAPAPAPVPAPLAARAFAPEPAPTRAPLRLPPLPAVGRSAAGSVGASLVIPNLVERSGLSPLTDPSGTATLEAAASVEATAAPVAEEAAAPIAAAAPAASTAAEAAAAEAPAPSEDLSAGTAITEAPVAAPIAAVEMSSGTDPSSAVAADPASAPAAARASTSDSRRLAEANEELHPSASGSMRASASGSRRVVHLVDVRPPGESQSRGRIAASESQSRGRVAAVEDDAPKVAHAGEATMQRAVAAALRGAAIDESAPEPELLDPLTSSTSSLTRMRREANLSTIEAATGEDDTIAVSGLHSRPSRGVITWVAAALAAMVVGTAGFALTWPVIDEAPKVEPAERPVEPAIGPAIAPTVAPEAAPPMIEAEPAVAPSPEAAPVAAAAVVASEEKDSKDAKASKKSGKASKKSGANKPRRKRSREVEVEPEEDDVLDQVRAYMRQKQATEAARAAAASERPPGALAN